MWRRVVCWVATDVSFSENTALFRSCDSGLVLLSARWLSPWVLTSSFGPANENRAPVSTDLLFPIYTPVSRLAGYSACHLLTCWFLLKLFLLPWGWRRNVPPRRRLQLNRLHGVTSLQQLSRLFLKKLLLTIFGCGHLTSWLEIHVPLCLPCLEALTETVPLNFLKYRYHIAHNILSRFKVKIVRWTFSFGNTVFRLRHYLQSVLVVPTLCYCKRSQRTLHSLLSRNKFVMSNSLDIQKKTTHQPFF
jgi:hypothetical protein